MRLTKLHYWEHKGQPEEWTVGPVQFANGMLLVGKNAAGKSRTITVIKYLADILRARRTTWAPGTWQVTFVEGTDIYVYELCCELNIVLSESLEINGHKMLERIADGTGQIELHNGSCVKFQIPKEAVAIVAKRDLYQHKYLEPLHLWASLLHFYPFGSDMGRRSMAIFMKGLPSADPTSFEHWLGIFRRGEKEHGTSFKEKVLAYMNRLSYDIEDIRLELARVEFEGTEGGQLPGPLHWIAVKERELACWTHQLALSQGMFRALSLMIQLAYAELSSQPSCILLDDVGEGLDFERSTSMIQLLLELADKHKIQVLMTTNDRFVMNVVPLEYWGIIRRRGGRCEVLTYENSRPMFEEFKLTGLSNFDLLRSGFFETAPDTKPVSGDSQES